MGLDELECYFREIRDAQAEFPQLHIHAGLECEYRPDLGSFQADTFLAPEGRCEYLVLAIHDYIAPSGEWVSSWHIKDTRLYLDYAAYAVRAMNSGLYRFLAHPDLFLVARGAWDENAVSAARMIAEAASALKIPLEINAAGMRRGLVRDLGGALRRPYPDPRFWEVVAQYPVCAVASSDAHRPEDVWNNTGDAEALARYYGIPLVGEAELFPKPLQAAAEVTP